MSIYTAKETPGKGVRYFKDKKFVAKSKIPQNIFKQLELGKEVDDKEVEPEKLTRSCLFCGEFAKYDRFVNMQTVAICEEHYYSETIGKIAQQLSKGDKNAKEKEEKVLNKG